MLRRALVTPTDLLGGTIVAGLMALTGAVLAAPLIGISGELAAVVRDVGETHRDLEHLAAQNASTRTAIAQSAELLSHEYQRSQLNIGQYLAEVSEACRARGVNIVDFQPVERPADGAHRSWDIHITATGAFPAFVEALAAIEVISPYAALRELAVTATPDQPSPTRISWTIRVTWAAAPSAKTETRP
ncbi:MAG: hypothetical protein CHACPFDD_00017 [Phycisphaerae bacterium]|nr:hypothetical protein [Phycisphaerae bacterium]